MLLLGAAVTFEKILAAIMADHFQQRLIGAIYVREFHIKDRIDPVLAQERTKTIFPAITGKDRAFIRCALAVKVNL